MTPPCARPPVDGSGRWTESITLARNRLRETRQPLKRVGIRVGARTRHVRLIDNQVEGFAVPVADLRRA